MQAFQQRQFGLEIDIVRQLQMRDEAGGFNVIGVGQHKLFILGGTGNLFVIVRRLQGAVDEGHGHRFALAHAEGQTVAAGEVRRLILRGDEAVDHFAFGEQQLANIDAKAQLFRDNLHLHVAAADLAGKRMVAAIAALSRIGQRQQVAFIAAH